MKREENTIDLVFIDLIFQNKIVECQVCQNLDYSSDHLSIVTEIALTPVEALLCQQQSWKRIDLKVVEIDI
jgi:hypothetical protein